MADLDQLLCYTVLEKYNHTIKFLQGVSWDLCKFVKWQKSAVCTIIKVVNAPNLVQKLNFIKNFALYLFILILKS